MRHSDERKEAVLKKLFPPNNRTVADVAEVEGIPAATAYKWRREARSQGRLVPDGGRGPNGWGSRDKLTAALETSSSSEAELAEYRRKRGLYPEQVKACEVVIPDEEDDVPANAFQRQFVRTPYAPASSAGARPSS